MGNLRNPFENHVFVQGRLTRDPELRYTSGNTALCSFSICNTEYFRDKAGAKQERTSFFDVKCWAKVAEYVAESMRKGADVQLSGRLAQESWEDKNTGAKRSKIVIIAARVQALAWADDGTPGMQGDTRTSHPEAAHDDEPISEDDIPF